MTADTDIEKGHFLECKCGCDEHVLRFTYVATPDPDPEVYVSVYLRHPGGFWGRLWGAVKYVLGYKTKYGDFDCFLMREGDVEGLIGLMELYRKDMKKQKELHQAKDGTGTR